MERMPGASADLNELAARGAIRHYGKGRLLIEEGEVGDALYIIVRGRLRAYAAGSNGREITYGSYGPGEYVGEMSLDGGPRSAHVETLERSVCAVVTRTTLLAFIAERPGFAIELMSKLIRRARAATLSARQMALNDVYGRLRSALDTLAGPADGDGTRVIEARLTHRDLASRLGCSREMISRLMKDLQRGGHVVVAGRSWRLRGQLPSRW